MKIVEVVWRDIIYDGGWHSQDEIDLVSTNLNQCLVKQIAYLYEEDENQIILIDSYFKDKDRYGSINVIPKGAIVKISYFESEIKEW